MTKNVQTPQKYNLTRQSNQNCRKRVKQNRKTNIPIACVLTRKADKHYKKRETRLQKTKSVNAAEH